MNHWLARALETHKFHAIKLREAKNNNHRWRMEDTAKALARSLGSISEDLLIAQWMRTHERELSNFRYKNDALEFIRNIKFDSETLT